VRVVGVMGHLGCADDPADPENRLGRLRFAWGLAQARAAGLRPVERHLAATAATLTDPASHHTMSRVGAGLVGIDPSRSTTLRPALTLTAPVVACRRVPTGTPVGYGATWRAERPTTLALLPVGYADGVPRAVSGRAEVTLHGRRHRLVGRVSMDQVVVDVGDHPVAVGDLVTLFGPGTTGEPTVAEWAGWAGTIEHEIVTGIGPRVRRVTVGGATR
jgi:alanine racemase